MSAPFPSNAGYYQAYTYFTYLMGQRIYDIFSFLPHLYQGDKISFHTLLIFVFFLFLCSFFLWIIFLYSFVGALYIC